MVDLVQRRRGWQGWSEDQRHLPWPSDVTPEKAKEWMNEWIDVQKKKSDYRWDKMYMDFAIRAAEESKCPRKKVGCCILLESGMISIGLNGFPEGKEELWNDGSQSNPLVTHAELNSMGKLLEEGVSCKNATVYVTLAPCIECSKLLVRAKVKRVVYLEQYRCSEGIDYLKTYGIHVEQFRGGEKMTHNYGGYGSRDVWRQAFDTELANTAMRYVDRAGDYCEVDPAERICDEFSEAMGDVIDRFCAMIGMPSVKYDMSGNLKEN